MPPGTYILSDTIVLNGIPGYYQSASLINQNLFQSIKKGIISSFLSNATKV